MMRLNWKRRSDPPLSPALRRRRRWRATIAAVVVSLVALAAADHLGAFGYRGDDWAKFDRADGRVVNVLDGATIKINVGGGETIVSLLGIATPKDQSADARETKHLIGLLENQTVRLKLEPLATRDEAGRLLAYVFLGESENVGMNLLQAGYARADRAREHSLQSMFELSESQARKAKRGIWSVD